MTSLEHPTSTSKPATPVRRDIQGLRAIAVGSVILYHAGLPVFGGFIGVDIFFVISGFVITGMLMREWQRTGRISLTNFYLRRFKRLTPALAVMIVFTLILSAVLFSPFDQQVIAGETGLGALLLVANWVIANTTGGYFDLAANQNPLLHTWSLSVEEQFYIIFPTLLLICLLIGVKWVRARWLPVAAVSALGLVSFAAVLYALKSIEVSSGTLFGFYSTVTRVWEFAAGAILALVIHRVKLSSSRATVTLGIVGAVMVLASFFVFNSATAWPGPFTVVPVVGTLLLILAGSGASNVISAALSVRPMVVIGDLSYSLYLWHWPLIVFATSIWPFAPWIGIPAAAVSILPAIASYRWVERPIRRSQLVRFRRILPVVAGFVVIPALICAGMLWAGPNLIAPLYESGKLSQVLKGGIDTVAYDNAVSKSSYPCTPKAVYDDALTYAGYVRCQQSKPGGDVSVAILGDSHAEHLYPGFQAALPNQNVAFYVDNFLPVRGTERMNRILDYLDSSTTVKTVIVSVNWSEKGVQVAPLASMINELTRTGKTVFVSDDNPTFGFGPFICKYRQGLLLGKRCDMSLAQFSTVHAKYLKQLDEVIAAAPGSHLLDVSDYFCNSTTCSMRHGDDVLYRDVNHLNALGSRFVAESLLRDNPDLGKGLGTIHR